MRSLFLRLVFTFLLLSSVCMARDMALISDKANPSSSLTDKEVLKLLKNETAQWPDGRKVTVYLSDPGSADGKLLLDRIYQMTPAELRAFARAQKGSIVILGSDDLVIKAVAAHPGALGVVNVYSINSAIKVLKVDGKLPLEQGYLLHAN